MRNNFFLISILNKLSINNFISTPMKKIYSFILISLFFSYSIGQINITQSNNATLLAQSLVGSGVTVLSATLDCPNVAAGLFTNAPGGLGISDGVVLTTGQILEINNDPAFNISNSNAAPGDQDLDDYLTSLGTGFTTGDACVLDLDLIITGESIAFNYVMGSQEYPEYVCDIYNDIFAFFITGANPNGPAYNKENIALIPSTSTPVTINSVNGGALGPGGSSGAALCDLNNTSFFNGAVNGIAYNGNTVILEAFAETVPCEVYNLKLAIADVGDLILDSGVFLEEGSIQSPVPTANTGGGGDIICEDGIVTVSGASASNGSILWTTNGNGTLTGETTLTPTYTAVSSDANSVVTLTLTVTSDFSCVIPPSDSDTYEITVNGLIGAGSIAANQSICTGEIPTTFTSVAPATGTGVINYQWQSSTNNGVTWNNISGATNLTYTSGALSQPTQFRRLALVDGCIISQQSSNVITVDIINSTDLSILKSVNNVNPDVGENVVFTLTVTNNGPCNDSGVTVSDLLPSGFTYVSHTGPGSYSSVTGNWNIGNLAVSSSVSLEITATVNTTGNYINIATVTGNTPDSDITNNISGVQVEPNCVVRNLVPNIGN